MPLFRSKPLERRPVPVRVGVVLLETSAGLQSAVCEPSAVRLPCLCPRYSQGIRRTAQRNQYERRKRCRLDWYPPRPRRMLPVAASVPGTSLAPAAPKTASARSLLSLKCLISEDPPVKAISSASRCWRWFAAACTAP